VRRAEHRTILVLDVEKFGERHRTNANQVAIRVGMYDALQRAFSETSVPWGKCYQEDRGDGMFLLAPPEVHKDLFSESFPRALAVALSEHNETHEPQEQIRMRMALHAGEINYDAHGVAGTALNQAFRLLEAGALKAALARSPGVLAMIASSWFYSEVITNSRACCPDMYCPVPVNVKETQTTGWIALPDYPNFHGNSGPGESWRVRVLDRKGRIHGAGVLIRGRYVITAAHVIAQSLGLRPEPPWPSGHVLFDLPKQQDIGVKQAEIVWWSPAEGNLAGLSVLGPAVRGADEPPLQRAAVATPRFVRIHRYPATGYGPGGVRSWARLAGYDGVEQNLLGPVTDSGPVVTRDYSGADVIDEETGMVLGVALGSAHPDDKDVVRMAPIETIANQWPLLGRIVAAGDDPPGSSRQPNDGVSPRPLSQAEFLNLIERCLKVPELAEAQSRHTIVSELPLEVALVAPRSSVGRADLAAVLWACAQVPMALTELRMQVQRKARDGKELRDLLEDLDLLQASLLRA
jgi:hypothetical protein